MYALEEKLRLSLSRSRWLRYTVLVAVSGGADSVALLRGLMNIRQENIPGKIVAVHANHQLRGAESDADADFVADLCVSLGVSCVSRRIRIQKTAAGLETDARRARYAFFESVAAEQGARYLFTAHTLNDHVETVLQRIFRGTGLTGLAGIARTRRLNDAVTLLRPMRDISRDEVLAYLTEIDQPFREDSSNASLAFLRNRIRRELIPLLKEKFNPHLESALLRLSEIAEETGEFLEACVSRIYAAAVSETAEHVTLRLSALRGESSLIQKETLRKIWTLRAWPMQEMGKAQWEALADLIAHPGPAAVFPGGVHVRYVAEEDGLWMNR